MKIDEENQKIDEENQKIDEENQKIDEENQKKIKMVEDNSLETILFLKQAEEAKKKRETTK